MKTVRALGNWRFRDAQTQDLTPVAALLLALVVTGIGLQWTSRVAAASDSYGYVSQADLWLQGRLIQPQDFVADLKIPMARWAFTPLGYRPEAGGYAIVPQYSPGLPLMMAAAKWLGGHRAAFWIVPLCGGLLVWATWFIGHRLGRPVVGLAAALLVASSPSVIFMLMAPMSDVPAAAFWALALGLGLGSTRTSATTAGVAAAIAILVRPNLAPLAALIALPMLFSDVARDGWRRVWRWHAVPFALAAGSGAAVNGLVNLHLFGSALQSGYGALSELFARHHFPVNVRLYVSWLLSAETPLAAVGLAALAVPAARLWRTQAASRGHWLLAAITAYVWTLYCFYLEFDVWWYLRFLLPAWPAMALGAAAALGWLSRTGGRATQVAAALIIAVVVGRGLVVATERGAFRIARDEARIPIVAQTVRALTDVDAVVVTHLHSGPIRYYAGRMTFRWDNIDGEYLDAAIQWLADRGHHPYLLLERSEVERLRARFAGLSTAARLDWPPKVSFFDGAIVLYDALQRDPNLPTALVAEPPSDPPLALPVAPPVWR